MATTGAVAGGAAGIVAEAAVPTKPPRPFGRQLGDFEDPAAGTRLTAAERALLAACARGEIAALNDPRPEAERTAAPTPRPAVKDDSTTVRAGFIRFLALGGDEANPVHESGVFLAGAFVTGVLDLGGVVLDRILGLNACIVEEKAKLSFATTQALDFTGSSFAQGLAAEGLRCQGSLWLRNVDAAGPVSLISADIAGYLLCEGLVVVAGDDWAFSAEGAHVAAQLRLYPSTDGATRAASITGGANLLGAVVDGDFDCTGAGFGAGGRTYSLYCQRMRVGGNFAFKAIHTLDGVVDLSAMTVGLLDDALADGSWARADGRLILDGFTYARLAPGTTTAAALRRDWLGHQQGGTTDWRPQPWDQLIAVLRASGHPLDATRLAIMKESAYRRAGKVRGPLRLFHWLHGIGVGYGYEPLRLAGWLLGLWAIAALVFAAVAPGALLRPVPGGVDPNCLAGRVVAGTAAPCPPKPRVFSPWRYSADLLVPGLHLGDGDEWVPNLPDGWPRTVPEVAAPPAWLGLFVWVERIVGGAGFSVLVVTVGSYLLKKRD